MKNITKILAFISLFAIVVMFTGAVSAADYDGNLGDSIQTAVNNTHNGDTIIVNDDNGSAYTNTDNSIVDKSQIQAKEGTNTTFKALNPSNTINNVHSGSSSKYAGIYLINGINEKKTGNVKIDHQTGKYIIGGTIIAGGVIMTGAGVAMGWNPVGWAGIGGGIATIGGGAAYIWG
jgi:hypothetical protein